jgi:hypothetical protein
MTSSIFLTSADYARAAAELAHDACRAELDAYRATDPHDLAAWVHSAERAATLAERAARSALAATRLRSESKQVARADSYATIARAAADRAAAHRIGQ